MAERLKTVEEIRERKRKAEKEKIRNWELLLEANKQKRLEVREKSKRKVETIRKRKKEKQNKKVKENKKNSINVPKPKSKVPQPETKPTPKESLSKETQKEEDVIDLKRQDVDNVKLLLKKFLDEGRDEFGLETLQMRLMQDGFQELSENKSSLVNCLKYLDSTTFVFYDVSTEVIWII